MLFSERRNSVIIESDLDTQLYDIDERESDNVISERNNSEDREQGVVRLGKKAKFTLKRVFSRSNSGQAIEMKTYALTNEKSWPIVILLVSEETASNMIFKEIVD